MTLKELEHELARLEWRKDFPVCIGKWHKGDADGPDCIIQMPLVAIDTKERGVVRLLPLKSRDTNHKKFYRDTAEECLDYALTVDDVLRLLKGKNENKEVIIVSGTGGRTKAHIIGSNFSPGLYHFENPTNNPYSRRYVLIYDKAVAWDQNTGTIYD